MKKFTYLSQAIAIAMLGTTLCNTLQAQTVQPVGSARFTTGAAGYTSIAIDKSGTPYVAFEDVANGNKLSIMKYTGSAWTLVGTAGISPGKALNTHIAIDNSGTPYVLYQDDTHYDYLVMMKYTGSTWTQVGSGYISPNKGENPSMTVDNSGTPYVAFTDWNAPTPLNGSVMKYNGSAWVYVGTAGFTGSQADYMTIRTDASGTPYVAYEDQSITPSPRLTVMKYNGTSWVAVGSKGFSAGLTYEPSMTLDASGNAYVVYSDWSLAPKQKATVMKFGGSSWTTLGSIGISNGTIFNPSIGVDKNGNVYVSYNDVDLGTKAVLKKYDGTTWTEVGATGGFSAGGTDFTAMTMDSHGNPYVVYSDTTASGGGKATVMSYQANTAVPTTPAKNNLQLFAFPNPCNGSFNIQAKKSMSFTVVNAAGQAIESGELDAANNYATTITGLEKGYYFILANNELQTTMIVVK